MSVLLALMGRKWWCAAGDMTLWSWEIWSEHNSQHLIDPYSLTHIEHGLVLWIVLKTLLENRLCDRRIFLLIAGIEGLWEVAENTPWIIERYREATISLDYFGDSIANSIADLVFCLLGAFFASRYPHWVSILGLFVLETICILWIRDSLLLNVLMLVYPIEVIRKWQTP